NIAGFIKALESFKDFDLGGLHPSLTYGPKKRYGTKYIRFYTIDKNNLNRFKFIGNYFPREEPLINGGKR
ncbi:MAG: hypothetical protein SV375_15050, partial [Thermodesulfobacteriota bacterium]|nr:hypothetical protein [Thermodesulfobacteriota bacterium]